MEIKEDDYIVGIWFVGWSDGNWLATLKQISTGFEMEYRFRHYEDAKVFNSEDRKTFYSFSFPRASSNPKLDEQEVIVKMGIISQKIMQFYNADTEEFISIGGGADKLIEALKSKDFAFMRTSFEELEKRGE